MGGGRDRRRLPPPRRPRLPHRPQHFWLRVAHGRDARAALAPPVAAATADGGGAEADARGAQAPVAAARPT
eukprot:3488019-Prymnesium_polylepis.1